MGEVERLFLLRWVDENVSAVPINRMREEALRLVARCIIDAEKQDISDEALEEAAEGDLVSYMLAALEEAAQRESAHAKSPQRTEATGRRDQQRRPRHGDRDRPARRGIRA
jgi:hypothetical protein